MGRTGHSFEVSVRLSRKPPVPLSTGAPFSWYGACSGVTGGLSDGRIGRQRVSVRKR